MRLKQRVNIHIVLLCIVLLTIAAVIFRFLTWGVRVNINDFASEYTDDYVDCLDVILPVLDENDRVIRDTDGITTIVFFGNAPFADDRDSPDNLVNMIAARTGATVYNCSVSGSYLASVEPSIYVDKTPMDAYNLYWLSLLASKLELVYGHYADAARVLGDDAPPEAQEVFDTLTNLDFSSVDVIAIMYDASDYLAGHEIKDARDGSAIQEVDGNLRASIEVLQKAYPRIRIIVMSPAYAYAVDESGNYVSSDIYVYGSSPLSTYSILEGAACTDTGVTFVDHLYGTITEDNAGEYLTDNLHLNLKGRELVAERFIKALRYFD